MVLEATYSFAKKWGGRALGWGALVGALAVGYGLASGNKGVAHGFYRARDYISEKMSEPMTTHDRQFEIRKYAIDDNDPTKLHLLTEFRGDPLNPLEYGRLVRFTVEDDKELITKLERTIEEGLNAKYIVRMSRGSPTQAERLVGRKVTVSRYNGKELWYINGTYLVKLHMLKITTDLPEPEETPFIPRRGNNAQQP